MPDQATILRGIVDRHEPHAQRVVTGDGPRRARTIAIASGKGGVGKSCIALNLAIALAQHGQTVALLDACLGLGSLDLLCGLNGYWNLSHVITAARSLKDIVLNAPAGVTLVPGASSLIELADCPEHVQAELLHQLQTIEQRHDYLIVDTSTGIHRIVRQFATAADQVLVVTVPESTAIADAYATVKALSGNDNPPLDLVINQTPSVQQARVIASRLQQTSKLFLRSELGFAGSIVADDAVKESVARRVPFVIGSPNCPAATDIHQLARYVVSTAGSLPSDYSYFAGFAAPSLRAA